MNTKIVIEYWRTTGQRDWKVANSLYKLKHYSACLFFCHLTLEKLLKGLVVIKTKESAPYIHDLVALALRAKLVFSDEQLQQLQVISTFNIAGRYDSIKLSFYKQATPSYTKHYLAIAKELYLWLEKQYPKK